MQGLQWLSVGTQGLTPHSFGSSRAASTSGTSNRVPATVTIVTICMTETQIAYEVGSSVRTRSA